VPRLSATPGSIQWAGARMGAHNDEILGGLLGLDGGQLAALRKLGAI
jgi:crotonobetainyl-CoA:carnitine CoA-transferase CaiB-like acyl-CoA transferase